MENVMEFLGKQSKKESYLDRDTFPSESGAHFYYKDRKYSSIGNTLVFSDGFS